MATAHINAAPGDFAETTLLPGDPLRAKHIAETFLERAEEVTNVRNMLGFTGYYKGHRVSVMGSGMGIPSASIYYKELITEYGVKNLIRIGSCGGLSRTVKARDVIIALGAGTDSQVNRIRFKGYDFAATCHYELLEKAVKAARNLGIKAKVGNLFTTDLFYSPDVEKLDILEKHGILGVEMEVAGLYGVAAEFGAKTLAVCTVSDHIRTGEDLDAKERQMSFNEMVEITLESVLL